MLHYAGAALTIRLFTCSITGPLLCAGADGETVLPWLGSVSTMKEFVAYPSRPRIALLVLAAAAFVAAGLWAAGMFGIPPASSRYSPEIIFGIGWFAVIFFGLCGVSGLQKFFDTKEQLRIGSAGVRAASWSDQTIPWIEIIDVTTWSFRGQRAILLHLRNPALFPGRGVAARLASVNRTLTGGDIAISLTGTDRSFTEAMSAMSTIGRRGNAAF